MLSYSTPLRDSPSHVMSKGYLEEQVGFLRRWKTFYFKFEDGVLARYEKESHVITGKKKVGGTP